MGRRREYKEGDMSMAMGYLVLENGMVFTGELLGGPVNVDGEAVF
jgi:carbamoylphosphate synthase small subunit